MSTIPPPPPPPIIPEVLPVKEVKVEQENKRKNDLDLCLWAADEPDLRETCLKHGICIKKVPYRYKYKLYESILQIGPTCGLVALSMLVNGEATPDELLSIAKLEGYTSNGEMFSCKHMAKLAEKAHSLAEIDNVKCTLKSGGLFSNETINLLLNGAAILVPYDADCNHEPCLRKGHTAHWALVCGVIVIDDHGENYVGTPENIFVFCKHGKSRYLTLWYLYDLDKSNGNLWEFSPKKDSDGLVYVLPEGGIGGEDGLRDQYLVFERF